MGAHDYRQSVKKTSVSVSFNRVAKQSKAALMKLRNYFSVSYKIAISILIKKYHGGYR